MYPNFELLSIHRRLSSSDKEILPTVHQGTFFGEMKNVTFFQLETFYTVFSGFFSS